MTKIEVIKDTYEFYKADPVGRRSVDDTREGNNTFDYCLYQGKDGRKCAFARWVEDEYLNDLEEGEPAFEVAMYAKFKDGVDIQDRKFWNRIQLFHDKRENWDMVNNTISEKGEAAYQELLKDYEHE